MRVAHVMAILLVTILGGADLAYGQFAAGSFTVSEVTVDEAAGSISLTIELSQAPNAYSVGIAQTVDGTAISGEDYTGNTFFLEWDAGDASSRDINIPILSDETPETPETFTVEIQEGDGISPGDPAVVTVTIVEGDAIFASWDLGSFVVPNPDGELGRLARGGDDIAVTMRLNRVPDEPFPVDYIVEPGGSPVTVTFDGTMEEVVVIQSPAEGAGVVQRFIRIVEDTAKRLSGHNPWTGMWAWLALDHEDPCVYCAVNVFLAYFGFGDCDGRCIGVWGVGCPPDLAKNQSGDTLRRYRDEILAATEAGATYIQLYRDVSWDVANALLDDPSILYDIHSAQGAWITAIAALVDGTGDSSIITTQMRDDMVDIINKLRAANPALESPLGDALAKLDPNTMAGLSMTQFQQRVEDAGSVSTDESSWGRVKARF